MCGFLQLIITKSSHLKRIFDTFLCFDILVCLTVTFFYSLNGKYARSQKNIRIFNYICINNFGSTYTPGALSCRLRVPNSPTYRHGLGDDLRDIKCCWHNESFTDTKTTLLSPQQSVTVPDETESRSPGTRSPAIS